ncbi:MAG: hypothetical protein ABWJ42_05880 [Sulfolobales archaeon]
MSLTPLLRENLRLLIRSSRKTDFTPYHMIRALYLLSVEGPLGRGLISKYLGLGEGSTRNLMRKLRDLGLIEIDLVAGGFLTERGEELVREWSSIIVSKCIERTDLVSWRYVAIHRISKQAERTILREYTRNILLLRDELVKRGCCGALIMRIVEGEPRLLNSRGEPEYSIKSTELGSRITELCDDLCIATGSDNSCVEAEACIWNLLVEVILQREV